MYQKLVNIEVNVYIGFYNILSTCLNYPGYQAQIFHCCEVFQHTYRWQ